MKNLSEYLKINESSTLTAQDIDAVADAIASFLNGDEFLIDYPKIKRGTGWEAAEKNGVWDVIEFYVGPGIGWRTIARKLDINRGDFYYFLKDNYDEIIKLLKDKYPEAKNIF